MELRKSKSLAPKPTRKKTRLHFPGRAYLEFIPLRILAAIMKLFPYGVSSAFAEFLGTCVYYSVLKRRRIALNNLDIAYGNLKTARQKRQIAQGAFGNMAVSIMDLFLIEKVIGCAKQRFALKGEKHFREAVARGRGVILVTSHLGSWEYLAFLFYLTGTECSVIVKEVRNKLINNYVGEMRGKSGLKAITETGAIRPLLKELKRNNTVAILIDQWAGKEGIESTFFGLKTSTTSIPARLAKRTGAVLIPAYCLRKPGGNYEIQVHPPINLCGNHKNWEHRTTEELNRQLEAQIKLYPEQWTWGHRRWKSMK